MNGWILILLSPVVLVIEWLTARTMAPFCRRFNILAHAMGGRHELRPAALGAALLIAFLVPLIFLVNVYPVTALDELYPPEMQSLFITAISVAGLVLLLWGWRCDRGHCGLESILILWTSYAVVWSAGLRIEQISLGGFGLGGTLHLPTVVSLVVTILWLTVVASVIELLDGVDGLAALVCLLIALASLGFSLLQGTGDHLVILYSWLLALVSGMSAWLGRPSGKFLLGKIGCYLLGFWVATLTILARHKGTTAKVLTPLLILGLILIAILFRFVEKSLGFGGGKPVKRRLPRK